MLDDADGLGLFLFYESRTPKRCLENLLDLFSVRCEFGCGYCDTRCREVNNISQVEKAFHSRLFHLDGKRDVDRSSVNGTVLQSRDSKQAFTQVDNFDAPIRIEPQIPHGQAGQIVDPARGEVNTQVFPLEICTETN